MRIVAAIKLDMSVAEAKLMGTALENYATFCQKELQKEDAKPGASQERLRWLRVRILEVTDLARKFTEAVG